MRGPRAGPRIRLRAGPRARSSPRRVRRSPAPQKRATALKGLLDYLIGRQRMKRRGRDRGGLGNPILIGALTVLVVIVAVILAYNANNGLPFVPRYILHVQVADASELTHGSRGPDGRRAGRVRRHRRPAPACRRASRSRCSNLKLDKSVEPLPVNSTFTIRAEGGDRAQVPPIEPGQLARATYPNGATVPLGTAGSDGRPRPGAVDVHARRRAPAWPRRPIGFGTALAGRGPDINNAIGAFVPLLDDLQPVARNLASPQTDLAGFLRGLESYNAALAPVAQTQADLFVNLDTTFRALASVVGPVAAEHDQPDTPPAFSAVIADSPDDPAVPDRQRGAVRRAPSRHRDAAAERARRSPTAFAAGIRNLPGTAGARRPARRACRSTLESYGQTPAVQQGLDRLTLTASSLRSPLAFLTPVQSSCNYVTLFLRNIASVLSESTTSGDLAAVLAGGDRRRPRRRGGSVEQALHHARTVPTVEHGAAPRQPVPEHRLARADGRVRGRQRAVLGRGQRRSANPPGNVRS